MTILIQLDYIAYVENKHGLYIGMTRINRQDGKTFIKIDAASGFTNWLPPHAEKPLTQRKKIEILAFLEKALSLLDYGFEISNKPRH